MGLYAFLPFVFSLALVLFFAFGWKRENVNREAIKAKRAKVHSAERALLAADHFKGFCEVQIIGVLPDGDTLMIGYRKRYDPSVPIFPGEIIRNNSVVEGTIITWPTGNEMHFIEPLSIWYENGTTVFMRVSESGGNLIFSDPANDVTVSIGLMPSNF